MPEEEVKTDSDITEKDIRKVLIFTLVMAGINITYFLYISLQFTILDYALIIGLGVLAVAPAYLANAGMALMGGGKPIDGGRLFWDGERIFGNGKTIKGFYWGFIIGTIGGFCLALLNPIFVAFAKTQILPTAYPWVSNLKLVTPDEVFEVLGWDLINNFDWKFLIRIPLLAIGAPIGDLVGSFFKRRFKVERGGQFPILDQLDFVGIAILIAYPVFWLKLHYILIVLLLTPLISLLGNWVAYKIGKKSVPW